MNNTDNWYQLPQDFNAWQQLIIANIARKCPSVPALISSIDMPKIDPVMGNADGIILIGDGIAAVPIVIRNCKLAPVDTMVTRDNSFFPLTDAFISKLYANNVIADAQNPPDSLGGGLVEDGPARKVRTVDIISQMKYASTTLRENLRQKIASSCEVATFFNQYRPEYLEALSPEYDGLAERETKVAAVEEQPKENLLLLTNDDGDYRINGKSINAKVAGELLKTSGASNEEKRSFLDGGFVCLDSREKHATLVPTIPAEGVTDVRTLLSGSHSAYMATAFTTNGVPVRGFLFNNPSSDMAPMFVGDDFYSLQDSFKVADAVPLGLEHIMESMEPEQPAIGAKGVLMAPGYVEYPVTITSVFKHGMRTTISYTAPGKGEEVQEVGAQTEFYSIPPKTQALMSTHNELVLSAPGYVYSVRLDNEGNLVIGDKKLSQNNALYSIMKETGLTIDDALDVANAVKTAGQTIFKIAKGDDDGEKATKEKKVSGQDPSKKTDKSGEKGSKKDDSASDKTESKSTGDSSSSSKGNGGKPKSESSGSNPKNSGQGQQADQGMAPPPPPVDPFQVKQQMAAQPSNLNFEDIQDIAKVNDPEVMDSYLSGTLTGANPAGREELMKVSDDTIMAIKSLSKLLFKVRLGQIDYVKESDLQTAINKMNDVCSAIGIASTQVNTPDPEQQNQGYPERTMADDSGNGNYYTGSY